MKRYLLIACVLLAACNRPDADVRGEFEPVSLDVIENPGCVFHRAATPQEDPFALFATYRDNPDDLAVVRYKGETLKLAPREEPDLSSDTIDVTYEVVDYLNWQVRLQVERMETLSAPATHAGTLTIVDTGVMSPISGTCER